MAEQPRIAYTGDVDFGGARILCYCCCTAKVMSGRQAQVDHRLGRQWSSVKWFPLQKLVVC